MVNLNLCPASAYFVVHQKQKKKKTFTLNHDWNYNCSLFRLQDFRAQRKNKLFSRLMKNIRTFSARNFKPSSEHKLEMDSFSWKRPNTELKCFVSSASVLRTRRSDGFKGAEDESIVRPKINRDRFVFLALSLHTDHTNDHQLDKSAFTKFKKNIPNDSNAIWS